ncbi:MAG: NAD(P)/FAD-dependent oxidoreductase [Desertifilum sp. SIO1I2]|nr:NAD(P)/FAD-dependent oxidoreductase [Desertifilum sp. SIO1I2]
MAHIVIIGAGLGGLPTAYELRHLLPPHHQITLISDSPTFTFIPSLPWVALGFKPLEAIQIPLESCLHPLGIQWICGKVTAIEPQVQRVSIGQQTLNYDYLAIATGVELALDALPGLGPDSGYSQSVCNPPHALAARRAWQQFLQQPGPLVVGAVPGASCLGPAYEFALLADYQLRKLGLRDAVPITFVTPEPYVGHLGIGEMANSAELVSQAMVKRGIEAIANTAVTALEPDSRSVRAASPPENPCGNRIHLSNGRSLPFSYAMLLPPFRGPQFLKAIPKLTDSNGFIPVLPTYQHPHYPSIYAVGTLVQLSPAERTPLPLGVPKTGQMTEAMAMAVAHNIAIALNELNAQPVTPTLTATCFADFGNTGILFVADPVLPDPLTGKRRQAKAFQGPWVSWSKTAFEQYFLAKMRWGSAVPWFERLGLQLFGLSLIEPLDPKSVEIPLQKFQPNSARK